MTLPKVARPKSAEFNFKPTGDRPILTSLHFLTKSQWRNIVVLMVAFASTRALAIWMGVRPLLSEPGFFMQYLDLDLLQHHLARCLLHLHSQPPLLNALVGVTEKLAGPNYTQLITAVYLILSFGAIVSIYLSLTKLCVSPTLSLIVSLAFLLNPSQILSEFDPIYTVPVIALNCFLVLAVICYLQYRTVGPLCWIVGLSVLLTLTRSSYQWIWIVAVLGIIWWQTPQTRAQIRIAAMVAIFLSLLWPMKNQLLYGHFISTTWGPLSMAKHWDWNGPAVGVIAREGLLTIGMPSDASEDAIKAQLKTRWQVAPTGFPELDDVSKQVGGYINWNSLAVLRLNDARQEDIRLLLRYDPREYAINVLHSVSIYFYPSTQYFAMFRDGNGPLRALAQHYRPLEATDGIFRRVCCTIFGSASATAIPPAVNEVHLVHAHTFTSIAKKLCIGILLLYGVLVVCTISFSLPSLWKDTQDRKVAAMIMIVTVAYSFVVVNLVEIGENERYRFETQALVYMAVAVFLQQLYDRRDIFVEGFHSRPAVKAAKNKQLVDVSR